MSEVGPECIEPEPDELEELAHLLEEREARGGGILPGAASPSPGGDPLTPGGESPTAPTGESIPTSGGPGGREATPAPDGKAASPGKSYDFAEVCSLLNLSPYALRGMLQDYGDLLQLEAGDDSLPMGKRKLSDWSFRLLREAVTLRSAGLSREEIRDRLRALGEAAAGLALVPGYDQGAGTQPWGLRYVDRATARDLLLIQKIEQLAEQLARSEERRSEDRDRLLMALLRTQQEVQQLRYELAARGRRQRKRKSWWERLLGR